MNFNTIRKSFISNSYRELVEKLIELILNIVFYEISTFLTLNQLLKISITDRDFDFYSMLSFQCFLLLVNVL